jgi:hypothetical protein
LKADDTPNQPSIRQSIKILYGASRGYLMVNAANLGDGIAYFGILTLMTLFMQHNVTMVALGAWFAIFLMAALTLNRRVVDMMIVARKWLVRGVRNDGVGEEIGSRGTT